MQFLFLGQVTQAVRSNPPTNLADLFGEEAVAARVLYGAGIFRQIWKTPMGAAALCEAESRKTLERHVAELPLVRAGCLTVELVDLAPYGGFSSPPPA